MARLTLVEVSTSVFDSDYDSEDFGHLDSESEEEMDEEVSAVVVGYVSACSAKL